MTFEERLAEAARQGWEVGKPYDVGNGKRLAHSIGDILAELYIYNDGTFAVIIGNNIIAKGGDTIPSHHDVLCIVEDLRESERIAEIRLTNLVEGSSSCVTANQLVHTNNRGWVRADCLTPEDQITTISSSSRLLKCKKLIVISPDQEPARPMLILDQPTLIGKEKKS